MFTASSEFLYELQLIVFTVSYNLVEHCTWFLAVTVLGWSEFLFFHVERIKLFDLFWTFLVPSFTASLICNPALSLTSYHSWFSPESLKISSTKYMWHRAFQSFRIKKTVFFLLAVWPARTRTRWSALCRAACLIKWAIKFRQLAGNCFLVLEFCRQHTKWGCVNTVRTHPHYHHHHHHTHCCQSTLWFLQI